VLSVLQYAVEVLDVEHVIVCGHYGCGGVKAATGPARNGLVDNWLGTIRDVLRWNAAELEEIADEKLRLNRLVELNVIQQVYNLSRTPTVQQAWEKRRRPLLHGLVYELAEGLLRPLVVAVDSNEKAHALFRREETLAHPPGSDAATVGSSGNRTNPAGIR
jgi:carbonic anhydrase